MFSVSDVINKVKQSVSGKKSEASTPKAVRSIGFSDVKNLNRPAPSWRWNLVLPPAVGDVKQGTSFQNKILKSISKFLTAAPDSRVILCESIEIPPNISLGRQERYYNGKMVTFPSLPSNPSVSAVFYESEDYATTDYFRKWQNAVYDQEKRIYGVPADYGRDIEFLGLPITDQEEVQRYISITLKKCWPVEMSKFSYGNTTDRVKLQVEFAFHDMEVTIVGGPTSDNKTDLGSVVNKIAKWRS